jgi:GTP-binding protein
VAIVGRPNVGKSTLFNRFAGRRRALVAGTPGVTRDRIAEEVLVLGRRVLLVDTAGLDPDAGGPIEGAVQEQARAAVASADAILFVVDGKSGLVPADHEIARELRRARKPLLLVVNKIDAAPHAARALEFHALGLEPLREVSAEHGRGAWDALEELVAKLPAPPEAAEPEEEAEIPRIALVGRPNVGKSSLLNRLFGGPRVAVSEVAGTTRDTIDALVVHGGRRFLFVDTAGLRRPGRRDRLVERGSALMAVRAIERATVSLVLIDASEGVTDQDLRILGLVRERGCAAAVLANKWDLVEAARDPQAAKRASDAIAHRLRVMPDLPVLRVSARTGKGVGRSFPLIDEIARAASQRIPTAELNRWLQESVARHEPTMAARGTRKRPIKFFYATQASTRPPTFVLFCTEPEAIQASYRRFLENRLREEFGFAGVPLRIRLRKRVRDESP